MCMCISQEPRTGYRYSNILFYAALEEDMVAKGAEEWFLALWHRKEHAEEWFGENVFTETCITFLPHEWAVFQYF